ncbi:zf-TFIIB domain-containing protein [bacterium]|nr:zf-TFIIB domain-containing protein [bacterium]
MSEPHPVSQEELKREVTNEDRYFQELDRQRLAASQRKDLTPKMVCRREGRPESGCPLETVEVEGLQVDRCAECGGVWLDKHELEDLLHRSKKKQPGLIERIVEVLVPRDHTQDPLP